METKHTMLWAKVVDEHGHPRIGDEEYEVVCDLCDSVFHGDYIIVTRNTERILVALGAYPTFQRVSQEITKLRESHATAYSVMEVVS